MKEDLSQAGTHGFQVSALVSRPTVTSIPMKLTQSGQIIALQSELLKLYASHCEL